MEQYPRPGLRHANDGRPVVVDQKTFSPQHEREATVTESPALVRERRKPLEQPRIVGAPQLYCATDREQRAIRYARSTPGSHPVEAFSLAVPLISHTGAIVRRVLGLRRNAARQPAATIHAPNSTMPDLSFESNP